MRRLSLAALMAVGLLVLPACTPDEQNTARAVAAAAIDAACNNIANMDSQFATVAPRANGSAQAAYASAKATIVAACNNRPLATPEQRVAAVTQAVARIATILAPLLAGG